jgi:hypothetical protein
VPRLTKTRKIHLVDLRGHHKIALSESANLVRVNLHVHLTPCQTQIWMVPLGFGHGAYTIYEIESRFKIREQIALRDVMLFDDFPVRQLLGERK